MRDRTTAGLLAAGGVLFRLVGVVRGDDDLTHREVGASRGGEARDGLRLRLEDALHGGGLVADGHGHRGGVLVALGRLDANAGVRDA